MEIQAGEYKLRPFKESDVKIFYDISHDEKVKKYVPYAYAENISDAKCMVSDYLKGDFKNDFYFLIEKGETVIGVLDAVRTIGSTLDVSAFLSKKFRGKGIMTIVMQTFINWLKENTDYEKLIMYIDKENKASNSQIKRINGVLKGERENNNIYEVKIK